MRSLSQLRQDALTVFRAGLEAVDAGVLVKRSLQRNGNSLQIAGCRYDLSGYRNVYIVGAGKAAAWMGNAAEEIFAASLAGGIVIVKYGHGTGLKKIEVCEAGHPIPDEAGVNATRKIMTLLSGAREDDFILFLISGGGSALLCCPADHLTLE